MLPLTFADPKDYEKIDPADRVSIVGLKTFAPGKPLTLKVHKPSGKTVDIKVIFEIIVDSRSSLTKPLMKDKSNGSRPDLRSTKWRKIKNFYSLIVKDMKSKSYFGRLIYALAERA